MTLLTPPRLRNSVRIVGAAVAALALLSACGGGGDSGGSASDSGAGGGGDNMAAGPIDKYIGTWKGDECYAYKKDQPILEVSTDQGKTNTETLWRRTLAIEKTNRTEASVKATYQFYQLTDDPICSKVIYTIKKIGVDPQNPNKRGPKKGESPSEEIWFGGVNKLVYKGNATVGGSVVDRLEYTEPSLFKLLPGVYAGGDIELPVTEGDPSLQMTVLPKNDHDYADVKTIAKVDGKTLTWAHFFEPGADYPKDFGKSPETFTKQ